MDGDDEVQSGEDRREAREEDSDDGGDDVGLEELGAEGRVERPAGIDAAVKDGVDHQQAADDKEVPAEQVDAREGEILGADHDRDKEVAQHGGHGGDEEEEDHHLAVHGEQLVIGIGLDEIARRGQQLQADEQRKNAADKEEESYRQQVEQRDALVVPGKEPRLDSVTCVQVALAFAHIYWYSGCHVFHLLLITQTKFCGWTGHSPVTTRPVTNQGVADAMPATGCPVCGWVSDFT